MLEVLWIGEIKSLESDTIGMSIISGPRLRLDWGHLVPLSVFHTHIYLCWLYPWLVLVHLIFSISGSADTLQCNISHVSQRPIIGCVFTKGFFVSVT